MNTKAGAIKCRTKLSSTASARQGTRDKLDQHGPPNPGPGPSAAALVSSVIGLLTIPCAVLADFYLLSALVEYIVSLASAGSALYARYLVPITLAIVNVSASLQRALEQYKPHGEYEPKSRRWTPIIAAILALQVAAAAAQYLAIQSSNPMPANAVILFFLGLLAIVTHAAVFLLAGDGILLITTAISQHGRNSKYAKLTNRLRIQTRDMFRHYQAFTDLSQQYKSEHPEAPALELDPLTVAELNHAVGTNPQPSAPPGPDPSHNPPPFQPEDFGDSPNPYDQVDHTQWGDDQRL